MTLPKRELTGEPAEEGSGSSSGSGNGNRLRDFRLDRLDPYRSSRKAPAMAPAAQMLTRP